MRKPDLYVVARFLDVLWWNRIGMKKTHLQMSARLNYQTFLRYLKWLKDHGLIKIITNDDGNDRILLSKKGIESHRRLVEWIKETMKDLKL
ncbi:MAG: winged helix-turn-helix domain-containing protein [Candidatus Bathyarchaeota archaeon]|nr:winged helix-turn-helix domain-containing protein [Candidatus Bathyarchaeota archaeon]